ncbi:1,3-beta-glucanosyltransferase Gel2 [Cordyceps javanica]|uniref:1,3-beta-glucanosyltransferase n=1 Tax=Cordyceps javanica TaxID=43265 RepID=A0A545VVJ4_9HYPO|nr:1,3-beta-glucanosyltransferase Gel2 [Cordyceps javanica]TQW05743.1 1,3-beta-glucanosyltransferase Gel2 [Cordyceps javanica]
MLIQTALVAIAATVVSAVKPLQVKGNEFFDPDTGNKFQIVGVGYQPGGSAGYKPADKKDPLTDAEACMRDAALMQILGINTVRVYNIDPYLDHDKCASIFNAAGMYLVIDVNSPLPGEAITSFNPWESYFGGYLNRTFAVMEAFANYPNTLLYFSGNEIINDIPSANVTPPYIRAVTRDLKNYAKKNFKRQIPIGYSAADVRDFTYDTWNYCQCTIDGEKDNMSRGDVYGLNSYSWCGIDATYTSSSYNELTDKFKSSSVPVFFSEYGCNQPQPRYWNESVALYGDQMNGVFSGGLVYEYSEEDKNYGLVNFTTDGARLLGDFNRLKNKLTKVDWKSVMAQKASQKDIDSPKCDKKLITHDGFLANWNLPPPPDNTNDMIEKGVSPKRNGKLVDISDFKVSLKVYDEQGNELKDLKVVAFQNDEANYPGKVSTDTGKETTSDSSSSGGGDTAKGDGKGDGNGAGKGDKKNGATFATPMVLAAALPALAMIFA